MAELVDTRCGKGARAGQPAHRAPRRTTTRVAWTLLACALVWLWPAAAAARADAPSPEGRAWIVVDARDGSVLASHGAALSMPVASTTKLMTAYVALHRLPPGRRIVAPPYEALPGESLMGLRAGDSVTARNLLYGLLLPSGNDAAVALADGVSGSVPAFVTAMNSAAVRLGLDDTHYANPIGLDDPGNYSSARDLASLTIRLRQDALFRRIVDSPRARIPGAHPMNPPNHNDLVRKVPWVNGVKTGYTLGAGYVLIGSGTRDQVTLVSVLLGAPSMKARDDGTLELLRHGFSLYESRAAVRRGERVATRRVRRGGAVPLVAARTVRVEARDDQAVEVRQPGRLRPLRADVEIRRGQPLGRARVTIDGRPVASVTLLAGRAVGPEDGDGGGIGGWPWSGCAAAVAIVILIAAVLARRRGGAHESGESRGQ